MTTAIQLQPSKSQTLQITTS